MLHHSDDLTLHALPHILDGICRICQIPGVGNCTPVGHLGLYTLKEIPGNIAYLSPTLSRHH